MSSSAKLATFGMGCFWSPDALFGIQPGVLNIRVGYAGGSRLNPTYRSLGDHTEVTHLEFDSNIISYEVNLNKLLEWMKSIGFVVRIQIEF